MKFGLRNIRLLLKSAGNPEKGFPSIHVGGTNGKGSTSAFLASVFTEAGYKTGLYTSPHLVRFTERIRINGDEIPEQRVADYVAALRPIIEKTQATFFEATTCVAFQYFADEQVDIAIVEVGLGGRLDSTNVIRPLVSVITNVGLDHTEYLGDTLSQIAREKAGIMKPSVPCVTATQDAEVLETFRRIARRKHCRLVQARRRVTIISDDDSGATPVVTLRSTHFNLRKVKLGLAGPHQIHNAAAAVAALEMLLSRNSLRHRFRRVTEISIRRGLENVRRNTGLRGRLEWVGKKILLDVAHNPDGIQTLVEALGTQKGVRYVVVFGALKDKDYRRMCDLLAPIARNVIAVRAPSPRGLDASSIAAEFKQRGVPVSVAATVREGVMMAERLASRNDRILVTGSHYVVGEALTALDEADA